VLTSLFADTLERLLHAELDAELGYQKHDQSPKTTTNRRNGSNSKTVLTKEGEMTINVPRDREGVFEPMILPKHERNVSRIQDKVLAMYKRGMSDRDISQTVEEIYGFGVSHETISNITDTILPTVKEWRSRPLKEVYTFVHIDALFTDVKIHGVSQKRAVYVALAIDTEGHKDVLGLWSSATESSKEWLNLFDEWKQRGVKKVTFLSSDGLKGIEDAVKTAFPETIFQRCIVHLIRNSLKYVPKKHYKEFCNDLKKIYKAINIELSKDALDELEQKWGESYPGAVRVWKNNYKFVEQLFDYPDAIRKIIYTTNSIESVNSALRKVTDRKGALPNEDALYKLLYLRIEDLTKKWTVPIPNWAIIRGQLDLIIPDLFL
jgi:transposase-like protein